MITKLTQKFTVAEHGKGDCLRTAFACVLGESDPSALPLFIYNDDEDMSDTGPDWFANMWRWFYDRGWELDTVNLEAFRAGNEMAPGTAELLNGYYVASGQSPRDYPDGSYMSHAVVCFGPDSEVVHDPHPLRTGLRTKATLAYTLTPHTQPSTTMPVDREMPKYKCHKEVWALKIKEVQSSIPTPSLPSPLPGECGIESGEGPIIHTLVFEDAGYAPIEVSGDFYFRHKPKAGGYYVVYKDGYKSFSPASEFEDGYSKLN